MRKIAKEVVKICILTGNGDLKGNCKNGKYSLKYTDIRKLKPGIKMVEKSFAITDVIV